MKYGLLTYTENKKTFNIGDYIQSLAAKQFLPQVDTFINRDKLSNYDGELVKIILNGWFTHNVHNWVPSSKINPLFISFHLNNTAAPYMLNEKGTAYLKKHQPIGCRDKYTEKILKMKGIDAYFSGCLTLTLDSYKVNDEDRTNNIYIVDPLYNFPSKEKIFYNKKRLVKSFFSRDIFKLNKKQSVLKKILSPELLNTATYVTQVLPANTYSEKEKFEIAENLLHKYAKAKLIITSRIHAALPALALGTPVIFINGFDSFVDTSRFDGIIELFNRIDISADGDISNNFNHKGLITPDISIQNLEKHIVLAEKMKKSCNKFIDQ